MTLKIYNTITGKKTDFIPLEENHVRIYVCGITAYDHCHIGHARSTLVFDMIVRYLRHCNYKVTYIRNFTDIDDKIIKRAAEQNTTTEELALRFIDAFHQDMDALGNQAPTLEPKATEHIQEIIDMIGELIAKGYAYESAGDVYFRVNRFNDYCKLSGRNLDDMQAGARISINDNKENPMDFALWKNSKPGEPVWESPWGGGRPGWHIECSAMSRKYLGDTFDIHGGGKDLIFPHHENELTQSEAVSGKPFAATWIHHGFVTIKDEKMSKSLGNFLTIREIMERYSAEVLRFFTFSTHYRSPIDFSEDAMREAESGLDRIYSCLATIADLPTTGVDGNTCAGKKNINKITGLSQRFQQAMDNDFNTAQAIGHIFDVIKALNIISQSLPEDPAASDLELLHQGAATIKYLAETMGLLQQDPRQYIKTKQEKIIQDLNIIPAEVDNLIKERDQARADNNWDRADEIRDILLKQKVEIKDSAQGTSWQIKI